MEVFNFERSIGVRRDARHAVLLDYFRCPAVIADITDSLVVEIAKLGHWHHPFFGISLRCH